MKLIDRPIGVGKVGCDVYERGQYTVLIRE